MKSTVLIAPNQQAIPLYENDGKPPVNYIPREYPQAIKYMGSKAKLLNFIGEGLSEVHDGKMPIVDLFSGSCSLSGGFGDRARIISNDIQMYSSAIASCYLKKCSKIGLIDIVAIAQPLAGEKLSFIPKNLGYPEETTLEKFNQIEVRNRKLINKDFPFEYHLYTKNYSGTWWSAEQCVWIDTLREVLDQLKKKRKISQADFDLGITCLMHAMAYSSQGTGHYAQYRDAKTVSSMRDISLYRKKSVPDLFQKKLNSMFAWNIKNVNDCGHEILSMDYTKCLNSIPKSIVYADPPYAFVHYSRFYHAMETLYKYDFPSLQIKNDSIVKGRYRDERHQSPFCISTQVKGAFYDLFSGIKDAKSSMMLSYSNTGMIELEELMSLASTVYGSKYKIWCENIDYQHKTMGRKEDHSRDVQEALIIARHS